MSDTYWVRYKGRSIGPYTLDRIRQMVRKGQVGRMHDVSTDGASWTPATSFPELFEPTSNALVPAAVTVEPVAVAVVEQPRAMVATAAPSDGPPAEAATWYCAVGGVQQGPMPRSQVLGMLRSGKLSASDLVFRSGMSDWTAASEVSELASALSQTTTGPAVGGGAVDSFCTACGTGLNKRAVICPKCGAPVGDGLFPQMGGPLVFGESRPIRRSGERKSKTTAALLALLVGGLGAHHFYLNNVALGIVYLVFCFTFIPALIALIEAIVFLTMSDDAFDEKYNP
jgi:TM2 domain-containing membrane protein YozV